MKKYTKRLKEMELRNDELKLIVRGPIVPVYKCDSLWTKNVKHEKYGGVWWNEDDEKLFLGYLGH